MARIRTIKPGFWKDQKIGKLRKEIRLMFIGLWNLADDEGIVNATPALIKSELFPFDEDLRITTISEWIEQLIKARMIIPFIYNDENYYLIRTFHVHQSINKKQDSKIPKEIIQGILPEYYRNDTGILPVGKEGKGKEEERKEDFFQLMKEVKIESCKMNPQTIGYKVIFYSIKLYEGFRKEFPDNKDLPLKTSREWIKPVRNLIETKGYDYENEIKPVLLWSLQDNFWKSKIIDTETLDKNFEKLKQQMKNAK